MRSNGWHPDVYAVPFVAQYLRTVNTLPAMIVPSVPPPDIDFVRFVASFCGSDFLRPLTSLPPVLRSRTGEVIATTGSLAETADFRPERYLDLLDVLEAEIVATHHFMQNFNLFDIQLDSHDRSPCLFSLAVPGIRENTPQVQLGDVVKLRQIPPATAMYPGGFTGYEYHTNVVGLDKKKGYVVLRADGLLVEMGGKFNVIFGVQEKHWEGMRRAVVDVGNSLALGPVTNLSSVGNRPGSSTALPSMDVQSTFLRKMLFPETEDCVMQHHLNRGVFGIRWVDKELNYEQKKAIDSILSQDYGNIPFLISGPPGTGKTKTIVETALQLIRRPTPSHPQHHILLCAPSQEAADTLALRLAAHLNPNELFRLQTSTRTFSEVPTTLLTFSCIENDHFSLPSWKQLMGFRIVVCSCRDADLLVQARCTNRDLCRWEKSVVDSLRGASDGESDSPNGVNLHWSVLLLDEAAQGSEPEVCVPLSVVVPPEEASKDCPIVVMAGDQKQLGPKTVKPGPLEKSAFERLFERPVYAEHPLSRGLVAGKESGDVSLLERRHMLPYARPPFSNLVRNYRSHPAILAVPSTLFYNDTLLAESRTTALLESWTGFPGSRSFPIKFMSNAGLDEPHEEGLSFYNTCEVGIAVKTVASLLSPSSWLDDVVPLQPEEIAVMSPFREQVRRLRTSFRAQGFWGVNVGPVEAYQGAEYRFVIICTTRARERFIKNDQEKCLGILKQPRRSNVALTRAKDGLVVIGNPWILEQDEVWKMWMTFAYRHDAWELDPEELTADEREGNDHTKGRTQRVNTWKPKGDSAKFVSRLEKGLMFRSKARDGGVFGVNGERDGDDYMVSAGAEAEERIREEDEAVEKGLDP